MEFTNTPYIPCNITAPVALAPAFPAWNNPSPSFCPCNTAPENVLGVA